MSFTHLNAACITVAAAGTVFLGVGVLFYIVAVHGVSSTSQITERWQIERRQFLAGTHRASPPRLYRLSGQRRILVDEYVDPFIYRDYGDDCVVYSTARTMNDQYYAVCGDRLPVLIGEYAFEMHEGQSRISDWEIEPSGLQQVLGPARRKGDLITVVEIKRRAMAQPPFREGRSLKE